MIQCRLFTVKTDVSGYVTYAWILRYGCNWKHQLHAVNIRFTRGYGALPFCYKLREQTTFLSLKLLCKFVPFTYSTRAVRASLKSSLCHHAYSRSVVTKIQQTDIFISHDLFLLAHLGARQTSSTDSLIVHPSRCCSLPGSRKAGGNSPLDWASQLHL